jgi:hypothetical protein
MGRLNLSLSPIHGGEVNARCPDKCLALEGVDAMPLEWIEVRCYSGHTYAQEPRSFVWRGREYAMESIERAWREPAGPRWRVRSAAGVVTLGYDEVEDAWWLEIASLRGS